MRHELDTVEERFLKVINQNNMVGEDFRMRASINWEKLLYERAETARLRNLISDLKKGEEHWVDLIAAHEATEEDQAMESEDLRGRIQVYLQKMAEKDATNADKDASNQGLNLDIQDLRSIID